MSLSVRISIHEIQPGVACGSDIVDDEGRLLLGRGTHLTLNYLQRLIDRGITHVCVGSADVAALKGNPEVQAKSRGKVKAKKAESHDVPLSARRVDRSGEPYSSERTERFASQLDSAVGIVEEIGQSAITISPASLSELCKVPLQMAEMLAEDTDQSLASAGSRAGVAELSERCVQMSMLAMSTAIEMELPDSEVVLVGIAGLLHDMGLFQMPAPMRDPSAILSLKELEAYRSHPELSHDLLKDFSEVSEEALLLILQVHELPDGSGYPRSLPEQSLHSLTRVMSAVEIYIALTSPGPGRPPIVPHDALGLMLYQCRHGKLDVEVMRAFVNQMTMFPIGSLVELNNGQKATVVRRMGNFFDEPVVAVEGASIDELIKLSESKLTIVAPVCEPSSQMRIAKSQMPTLPLESMLRSQIPAECA